MYAAGAKIETAKLAGWEKEKLGNKVNHYTELFTDSGSAKGLPNSRENN